MRAQPLQRLHRLRHAVGVAYQRAFGQLQGQPVSRQPRLGQRLLNEQRYIVTLQLDGRNVDRNLDSAMSACAPIPIGKSLCCRTQRPPTQRDDQTRFFRHGNKVVWRHFAPAIPRPACKCFKRHNAPVRQIPDGLERQPQSVAVNRAAQRGFHSEFLTRLVERLHLIGFHQSGGLGTFHRKLRLADEVFRLFHAVPAKGDAD